MTSVVFTLDGTTNSLIDIGENAFYKSDISVVNIPTGVTKIGNNAFSGCTSLNSVTYISFTNLKIIGNAAFYDTRLSNAILPRSITSIGADAFDEISTLTSFGLYDVDIACEINAVTIPASVIIIPNRSFYECNPITITFAATSGLKIVGPRLNAQ